jgi:transcriptional regulator GlxA family with amidase domain
MAILAPSDSVILNITGLLQVFTTADQIYRKCTGRSLYTVDVVSTTQELAIRTAENIVIMATQTVGTLDCSIDTLLTAGGGDIDGAERLSDLTYWLRRVSPSARRVGAVHTGAFLLAAAGLLRGLRATTHWAKCEELARRYPETRVELDRIFVCDAGVYTSAGVTAAMDLALALVEEDAGAEIAFSVARELILYLRKPGEHPQLSAALTLQRADHRAIRDLQSWITDHLADALSVNSLADRAAMSPRNFARVFSAEMGITPAKFIHNLRVETARRRLEETNDTIDQIALQCGFRSPDSMRRVFRRLLRKTPGDFRRARRTRLQAETSPKQSQSFLDSGGWDGTVSEGKAGAR